MNNLLKYREKLNLTQDELAEKAGISVRTIQRIESGGVLKGHTLKILAETLNVSESDLKEDTSYEDPIDFRWAKIINSSSILGILLPPLNILIPLILIHVKKEVNDLTKQIISVQILWTIISVVVFFLGVFVKRWFGLNNQFTIVTMLLPLLVNLIIILLNTISIDKKQKLSIRLGFSFI